MATKCCSKCNVEKGFEFFSPHHKALYGLQSICKQCRNEYNKKRRSIKEKKEQDLIQAKIYRSNPENRIKRNMQSAEWKKNNKARHSFLNQKRKKQVKIATPSWSNLDHVFGLYEVCGIFQKIGISMQVDHIVPIQSNLVCGLHVTDNLRLITAQENQSKGNRHWPNMPELT